jgi:hypothetical protein
MERGSASGGRASTAAARASRLASAALWNSGSLSGATGGTAADESQRRACAAAAAEAAGGKGCDVQRDSSETARDPNIMNQQIEFLEFLEFGIGIPISESESKSEKLRSDPKFCGFL